MKRLLRVFIIETFALFVGSSVAYGVVFEKGIETLLFAGIGLTAIALIVKPIINLLLLPLNLITFNVFKWVSSAVGLYLVTLLVPGFKIITFRFSGFSLGIIDMPVIDLSGAFAFIGFSFIISFFAGFIYWLIRCE